MGNDAEKARKKAAKVQQQQQQQNLLSQTSSAVTNSLQPSPIEDELRDVSQSMYGSYGQARDRQNADYGSMMSGYGDISSQLASRKPTQFNWDNVSTERAPELDESYGYLREAMPGYRDFAATGGYSEKDQQELRARGMSPIRSSYQNTMMELDRSRSLGGAGGSPNYIAAASRAQRDLPGQMSDAMTTVNAGLAESIRAGKLQGLAGMTNVGSTMGGLSGQESARVMEGQLANSRGKLQAAGMTEDSYNTNIGQRMAALSGQANLYGTTPGMTSMFGNQALSAYGQRAGAQSSRQSYGLGLIRANMDALYPPQEPKGPSKTQTALQIAGAASPYVGAMMGGGGAAAGIAGGATAAGVGAGVAGGTAAGIGAGVAGGTAAGVGGAAAGGTAAGIGGAAGTAGALGTIGAFAGGAAAPYLIGQMINPSKNHITPPPTQEQQTRDLLAYMGPQSPEYQQAIAEMAAAIGYSVEHFKESYGWP